MSDLTVDGGSNYTTSGTPDTATALADGPTGNDAVSAHINGPARAIVDVQNLLGNALTLIGSTPDLVSRLAVILDDDGTFNKGTAFPGSPIDGQPFYRTDLDVLYIYDAGSTTWKAGSDNGTFVLTDGSRDFTGDIKIKKNAPALRLKGTEGSGLDLQIKESAGILILSRNTGTEGIPVWTEFFRLAPTTGELTTLLAKLTGTGNFKAILSHANSADRTYTLQDSSDVLVGRDTTDTLTNKTLTTPQINSPVVTGNTIGTGAIKTAAGSASAAADLNVTMNRFSFFPSTGHSASVAETILTYPGTDPANAIGRFRVLVPSGTITIRWDYFTASDDPTIWVAFNLATGEIMGVWASDDPTPGDIPGITINGCTSVKMKASELEHLTVLSAKASEAEAFVKDNKLREEHLAYRALQLMTDDVAPSRWLLENCSMGQNGLLKVEKIAVKKTVMRKRKK